MFSLPFSNKGNKARRINLGFNQQQSRAPQTPPSPASFVSPDIIDISSYDERASPQPSPPARPPPPPASSMGTPPRINLDFASGPALSTDILGPQAIAFRRQASALVAGPKHSLSRSPAVPVPATADPTISTGFTGQNTAYASQVSFSFGSPGPSTGSSSGAGSARRDRFGSPANGSFGSAVGTPGSGSFERTRERYNTPPADLSSPNTGFLSNMPRNGSFGSAVGRPPMPSLPASPRPPNRQLAPSSTLPPLPPPRDDSVGSTTIPIASSSKISKPEDLSCMSFGSEDDHDDQAHDMAHPFARARPPAPTPIRIPELPREQRYRRFDTSAYPRSADADSTPDSELASAVSGSTLAAALGQAFYFSPDSARRASGRKSRTVTRQDSAVLPRDENPFMSSPYRAEADVPPVPPMPESLRRRLSDPTLEGGVVVPVRLSRRMSASSVISATPSATSVKARRRRSTLNGSAKDLVLEDLLEEAHNRSSKRISRIEEADSPLPSLADSPAVPHTANSENTVSSKSRYSAPPTANPISAGLPPQPGSANSANSAGSAGSAGSGKSGNTDIYNILDGYQFVSPLATPSSFKSQQSTRRSKALSAKSPLGKTAFKAKDMARRKSGYKRGSRGRSQLLPIGVQPTGPRLQRTDSSASSYLSETSSIPIITRQDSMMSASRSMEEFPLSPNETIEFFGPGYTDSVALTPAIIATATTSMLSRPAGGPVLLNPRTIFTRPRSRSIPQPIAVVRDSRDGMYSITFTEDNDPESTSARTGAGGALVGLGLVPEESSAGSHQTFPETPAFPETPGAFSPMWSPGANARGVPSMVLFGAGKDGVALPGPEADLVIPPPLMRSASVAGPAVLATLRAKLTGHALSRSATLSQTLIGEFPKEGSEAASPVPSRSEPPAKALAVTTEPLTAKDDHIVEDAKNVVEKEEGAPGCSWSPAPLLRISPKARANTRSPSPARRLPITPAPSDPPSRQPSPLPRVQPAASTNATPSNRSRSSSPTRPLPDTGSVPGSDSMSRTGSGSSLAYLATSAAGHPSSITALSPVIGEPESPPDEASTPITLEDAPRPRNPPGRAAPPSPPDSILFGDSTIPHHSYVAPPPYMSIADDLRFEHVIAPPGPLRAHSEPIVEAASTGLTTPDSSSSHPASPEALAPLTARISRRMRPIGPRRPTTILAPTGPRGRNASVSSVQSTTSAGGSTHTLTPSARPQPPSSATPNVGPSFMTTPVRWRGFTLDVAKWTFTSEQLQAIVSRAIRQSADAAALRLLPLDVLDKDIPEELEALDSRSADVRAQYKVLAGRRSFLLSTLTSAVAEGVEGGERDLSRMVEELSELTTMLDTLAEDMHTMNDQIKQLRALLDTHTYSALAMALRKLNGSFLKQVGEVQALRSTVVALQVERDEAWKQAQDVAQELDDLNARTAERESTLGHDPDTPQPIPEHEALAPGPRSARSSKMSSRKNSVRASRLSSSFRRSQRSSTYSFASSAARSTFEDVPPVPVMPLRRPLAVRTSDIPDHVPTALSTGGSPASGADAFALVEAQKQLYAMLGISSADVLRSSSVPLAGASGRRPRPVSLTLASPAETRPVSTVPALRPRSATGHRVLQLGKQAVEAATLDDHAAVLATLEYI